MANDPFGIGFVSCGFITRESHIPSVGYLPDVHVAAIQNRTTETAQDMAETCRENGWGDPTVYGEDQIGAMVADPSVDAIWVTGPNFLRVPTVDAIVDAVEDGASIKGIAIEKPLARTVEEGTYLLDRIEKAAIPHAYLENWPHEPDIDDMRTILWERGRESGRPYIARSQAEHGGPHSAWFWDGDKQGGGALTDMLCHALAGNHVLLADPALKESDLVPVEISARTETLKWARPAYADELRATHGVDYRKEPADDYATVTVRYETPDGTPVISEATGSWCYVGAGVRRSIELLGPEYSGRVETDESSSSVFFSDAAGGGEGWAEKQTATSGRMPISAAPTVTGGFVAENRDAVNAFRAGGNGRLDLTFGQEILRLCMAAYKADETGETLNLEEADVETYLPEPAR